MAEIPPHDNGMSRRVLIIPACRRGDGLGHLKRSISLAEQIGDGAKILIPDASVPGNVMLKVPGKQILSQPGELTRWNCVIIDKRKTATPDILPFIEAGIPVIGIDEGGEAREYCTFLIDILPFPASHRANIRETGYLPLPAYSPMGRGGIERVLISFGGEDPEHLTAKTAEFLVRENYFRPEQIKAIIGPLFDPVTLPPGVASLPPSESMYSHFRASDLVITSFGITPFEAAYSGVPVMILNPTVYHRKCTRLAGLPEVGVGKIERRKIRYYLDNPELLKQKSSVPLPGKTRSLAQTLSTLSFPSSSACPACGAKGNKAVGRFPEKSCFTCSACGGLYSVPFTPREEYDKDYFFRDYKEQYGKTYLEDYFHIYALGKKRMGNVMSLLKPETRKSIPALLDVGCAFGPFLEAARDAGCSPFGIDVSSEAVAYIRRNLDLPAGAVTFEEFNSAQMFGREKYDIITMWFVLEHLEDLQGALKKISAMLVPGGVFAFSTPNLRGISGRKDLHAFLEASPEDHFTLWSPGWAKAILKRCGLAIKKIEITGHHPERFPGAAGKVGSSGSSILTGISRFFQLGDTFEGYGVKL